MEGLLQGIQAQGGRPGHPAPRVPGARTEMRPHKDDQGPRPNRGDGGDRPTRSHQGYGSDAGQLPGTFAMARMTQDRGESCRSFFSRLRGVARTCDFMETCPNCNHQVDCSESRVSDQLCIGLADPEIQEDLLEEITKRLTIEQVLKFVEKKTLGKRAASALKTPTTPSASALDDGDDLEDHVSSYKKLPNHPKAKTTPKATPKRPRATAQTKARAASVANKGMAHRPGRP